MANDLIQKLTNQIKKIEEENKLLKSLLPEEDQSHKIEALKRSLSTSKGNYTKLKTKYEQAKIQVTQLEEARKADIALYNSIIYAAIAGFVIMTVVVILTNFF